MAQRDELLAFMDSYLEIERFKDYAPIGLQIEGKAEVHKIATGVSASMELFEKSAEWRADMILVHHGMFWRNSDPVLRGHLKARVKFLLDHEITLAGYHLPLDAHAEIGNNALFAKAMGMTDLEPFGEHNGLFVGWRGTLEAIRIADFAARAEGFYDCAPKAIFAGKETITSAAIVSGGAWTDILPAARAGADCLVTGTADEPVWYLAHEEKINFLAFGHHATEKAGIRRLGEVLCERFGVEARFVDTENPF